MDGFSIRDINTSEFRKAIKENQGYKCHICGEKHYAHNLEIAHIKDKAVYKKKTKSFLLYNLKAMCRNCHGNFDDYKRFTKNPPITWSDYNKLLLKLKKEAQKKKSSIKPMKKKITKKTKQKTSTIKKSVKKKTTKKKKRFKFF